MPPASSDRRPNFSRSFRQTFYTASRGVRKHEGRQRAQPRHRLSACMTIHNTSTTPAVAAVQPVNQPVLKLALDVHVQSIVVAAMADALLKPVRRFGPARVSELGQKPARGGLGHHLLLRSRSLRLWVASPTQRLGCDQLRDPVRGTGMNITAESRLTGPTREPCWWPWTGLSPGNPRPWRWCGCPVKWRNNDAPGAGCVRNW